MPAVAAAYQSIVLPVDVAAVKLTIPVAHLLLFVTDEIVGGIHVGVLV